MDLNISTDWTYRGLQTVVLENRLLRVVILPEAGAKIWQISYKPLNAELLWNNPRTPPALLPLHARYDDVWCGGWDELFPNDEAGVIDGEAYPDHGELWTGRWRAEPFGGADEVGVHLRYTTPISAIAMEKTVRLRRDSACLEFQHQLRNVGNAPFPFLWKLHPALAVTAQHRVDFPAMRVHLEPAFPGTLAGAPPSFDWPHVEIDGRHIDLRRVAPAAERQLYFFYGSALQSGWCGLTDTASGLGCGLVFDPVVFPSCWLFASYGGWRNHNVAVLEPCTGYPLNFDALRAAGRQRILAPGESLNTAVRFVVQEGLRGIAGIAADGRLLGV